jgi:plastocyanin
MKPGRAFFVAAAAAAVAVTLPTMGAANDGDRRTPPPPKDVVVQFGQPQPQSTPASATHFLLPDDVTIREGGTVTFVVNGGGHGVAIYPVSRNTTRADILGDLCQGGAAVCNGTAPTTDPENPVGTQNLRYQIRDGRNHLVIDTDTGAHQPRVDDPRDRLLATSGGIPGEAAPTGGAFLVGTTPTAVGNRIQYRFTKSGRFLVICQNRGHLLNDGMFGFVTVRESDHDDDDHDHDGHH